MGAVALAQSVKHTLAAATQARSAVAPRTAEVLQLVPLLKMKRIADESVEIADRLRQDLIKGAEGLSCSAKKVIEEGVPWEPSKAEALAADISKARDQLSKNFWDELTDSFARWAATAKLRSADEGRYAKRAANRVRQAFDACEAPRVMVLEALAEAAECVKVGSRSADNDERHRHDDLFRSVIDDHPLVNAYLGR